MEKRGLETNKNRRREGSEGKRDEMKEVKEQVNLDISKKIIKYELEEKIVITQIYGATEDVKIIYF